MSKLSRKTGKRIRRIRTRHGIIETPCFWPDATRGFVKSLGREDLKNAGIGQLVVNTYHLFLQPGLEIIQKAGGIHRFMDWDRPLLSDSGGYQVYSLIHKNPQLGKVTENEVVFRSPLDGSVQRITPEKAIQIQFDLGVDIMVCLDDPRPNTASKAEIGRAVERTLCWAARSKAEYHRQIRKRKIISSKKPLILGVIQGGAHLDLRERCVRGLVEIGFDGYGFGARHVDTEGKFMEEVMGFTASLIPDKAIRFALGVGTPEDILRSHALGWDMFDCVIPTREGRHGRLFLWKGKGSSGMMKRKIRFYETININNRKFKNDFRPVDPGCDCALCRSHSRAYLRHLFASGDPLGARLASHHNLTFYARLMDKLKEGGGGV